jgi:hypothetical protein
MGLNDRILVDRETKKEVQKRKELLKAAGHDDVDENDVVRRALRKDQDILDPEERDDLRILDGGMFD